MIIVDFKRSIKDEKKGRCDVTMKGDYNQILTEFESAGIAIISSAVESAPDPIDALQCFAEVQADLLDHVRARLSDIIKEDK